MKRLFFLIAMLICAMPLWAQQKEGGIIGTGILGQITALGSIYVNGLHIEFADDMTLEGTADQDDLTPGMTVAAAIRKSSAGWEATAVRRVPVLVGPITGPGQVMGVTVTGMAVPVSGWVSIDGFWNAGGVVATRVQTTPPGLAETTGPYGSGRRVGDITFRGIEPLHLDDGQIVTIKGRFEDGGLAVTSLQRGLFAGAEPSLILAEGYLSTPDPAGMYRLIGAGVVAYTDRPGMIDPTERTIRCAIDGRMDYDVQKLSQELGVLVSGICSQ